MRAIPPVLLLMLWLLAACSSSREVSKAPESEVPPTVEAPPSEEPPPRVETPPEPEPPPEEKATPRPRTVQGFRIQILTTAEKEAADDEMQDAIAWWSALPASRRPDGLGRGDLSVDVKWKQPYYRVRLGDFAARSDATRALTAVKQQFPDAFIVPDTVTIWR